MVANLLFQVIRAAKLLLVVTRVVKLLLAATRVVKLPVETIIHKSIGLSI